MQAVLRRANERGLPVFQFDFDIAPKTNPELLALAGDNWVHIDKPFESAFQRTNLEKDLRDRGVTDVILMGFNQIACVRLTAYDARARGFNVHTSFDVIQGFAGQLDKSVRGDYKQLGGLYRDHSKLLDLLGDSERPCLESPCSGDRGR